ncbi:MAG: hypothetical protein MK202_03255 [Tenacibaculum sp.]|nr:hypothetical protein [Tenacibaculum sp.]
MKLYKKKLSDFGIVMAVVLGTFFSVLNENSEASEELTHEENGKITCWSYSTSPLISFRRHVECATCSRVSGKPLGGQGQCTSN